MSYRFTIANTSNVDLQNFYFHDKIPYDVTTVSALTTGTYNARLTYRILYKTNYNDYRVLASNLLSTNNYSFGLSGLQLILRLWNCPLWFSECDKADSHGIC